MQAVRKTVAVLTTAVAVLGWTAVAVPAATAAPAPSATSPHRISATTGLPSGMVPTATRRAAARTAAAPTGNLTYHGGPVVSNAEVASVLWGSGTYLPEVTSSSSPSMATFFPGVARSPHVAWLNGEYGTNVLGGSQQTIGLGTYMGRTDLALTTAGAAAATVTDDAIRSELDADVLSGALPAPTTDAGGNTNTVYALFFPAGTDITFTDQTGTYTSGVDFCAYHSAMLTSDSRILNYMVLPDDTTGGMAAGCGAGTSFQNLEYYASHELIETITDPLGYAWYDSSTGNEIGDICNQDEQPVTGADGVTYTVQTEWSNAQAACIVQKAGALDHLTATAAAPSLAAGTPNPVMVEGFDATSNSLGDLTMQSVLTVAPDGACDATSCAAHTAGTATITATDGAKTATVDYTVTHALADHLTLSPSTPQITAGGSQPFTVTGVDAYANSWDATSTTTFSVAPNGSCTGASCSATTAGSHTVTGHLDGKTGTATLDVVPGPLDHLGVHPATPGTPAGSPDAITVRGLDAYGNDLGDVTSASTLSIAPNGSCDATSCTSTTAGTHTVTADDAGKTGSATLSVVPGPVDHLAVSSLPTSVEIASPATISVTGFDAYGNSLGDVTTASTLSIGPDGSCSGNLCTPRALGAHTITATYGGKTATGSLTAVDTHAPTATLTRPTAAQVLGSSAVVSWTGADTGSGVATYQVRYQRAPWNGRFGAWSYPAAWQTLTTTSLTATRLARGYDYCFSARAIDRAGNVSQWTAARCIAVPLDDRALSPSTGWTRASSTRFWNSTATGTTRRGASLVRTGARFTRVGVVATRCANCGVVAVYSGSTYLGRLNLAASRTSYRSVLMLRRVSLRSATITLRVLSSGKLVQVDGLVLLPT
jgi:hypothetical protein